MYGSSSYNNPPLTNNPFIESTSHPSERYPDISSPPSQPSQQQWTDPAHLTSPQQQYQPDIYQRYPVQQGYPPQPQQFQPTLQQHIPLSQPPQPPQNYLSQYQSPPPQPAPQPTGPFQPNSTFGQTLPSSMNVDGYGYPQSGQPIPQQQHTTPVYNPAQQQLSNPSYVAQFDPYASQGWATDTATPQSQQSLSSTNNNTNFGYGNSNNNNLGPSGEPHPRDYIHSHRQEIEAWDSYTWKQLLNSCEALKTSWESKRNDLKNKLAGLQNQLRYAGYYDRTQIQQEGVRIQVVS